MSFTNAQTMQRAITIFFISCFMGVGLALIGGLCLDTWFNAMLDVGWFDVPAEWDSSTARTFLMGLFYFGCLCIPAYGIAVLVITIYHKYVLDDDEDESIGSNTYIGGNI